MSENTSALNAFMVAIRKADDMTMSLMHHICNHFDLAPEDVTWSNVADAQYLVNQLREIADHFNLAGKE